MNIGRAIVTIAMASLVCAFSHAGESDLDIVSMKPLGNFHAPFDFWEVHFRNPGAPTQGVLQVRREGFSSSQVVDIPTQPNALKGVGTLVYFPAGAILNWPNETTLSIRTKDGRRASERSQTPIYLDNSPGSNSQRLMLGTKWSREMLRMGNPTLNCSEAPEIAAAYLPFTSVVLGAGSQDLSDRAIDALLHYAAAGGNIIFLPKQDRCALDDPRWASYIPAKVVGEAHIIVSEDPRANPAVKSVHLSPVEMVNLKAAPGALTLTLAKPKTVTAVQRRIGIGSTVVSAYTGIGGFATDPLAYLADTLPTNQPHFHDQPLRDGNDSSNVFGVPPIPQQMPGADSATQSRDPFHAKPPSLLRVVLTLMGYAAAVILAAVLGQKIFKKGEIAWVTTPILSLGFAGFFFSFAGDLYRSKESRSLAGLVVGDTVSGKGYTMGTTQIFIPKGGTKNFNVEGVEVLIPNRPNISGIDYRSANETAFQNLNLVQTPTGFMAPKAEVDNLAFLSYRFQQRVDVKDWFKVKVRIQRQNGATFATGSVQNNTAYAVKCPAITVGEQQFLVPDISPHATVPFKLARCTRFVGVSPLAKMPDFTHQNRMGIEGEIQGFTPGPQIGEITEEHTKMNMALDLGPQVLGS